MGRWTFNANADALGDEAHYTRVRDSWNPPGQLLMNGLSGSSPQNVVVRLATSLRGRHGNTVYRQYESGEREKRFWKYRSPEDHERWMAGYQSPPWLWWQVGNEPAFDRGEADVREMCHWLALRIRRAVVTGDRLVVYNPSVGGFELDWIARGWFDELLIELARNVHRKVDGWPQFVLGSHSTAYWMGIAAVHMAGRNPTDLLDQKKLDPKTWPTQQQVFDADTSDNWVCFRDWWFIERTRKLQRELNINVGTDISIIATEAGPENLPNIRKQFPQVAAHMDKICGREYRGVRAAQPYYAWAFPQWTAAEATCFDMMQIEKVAPEQYLMFAAYQWTWHEQAPEHWRRDYNWGEEEEVLAAWALLTSTGQPVPTPIPQPKPGVSLDAVIKLLQSHWHELEG